MRHEISGTTMQRVAVDLNAGETLFLATLGTVAGAATVGGIIGSLLGD